MIQAEEQPRTNKRTLLRHTEAVCPTCLNRVAGSVTIDEGTVKLEKHCPDDGESFEIISNNSDYWAELDSFYFSVNEKCVPQRDFIVRMTEDCNLDCPICLAKANTEETEDLDLSGLEELINERRGIKIDLMAAEPTLRSDLEDWIRKVKASGNIAALHTNGLKIANREYAERIKEAGIDEIFVQFDGFDDDAHMVLRGRKLVKTRMAAMKNLRELKIATSLIVVIAKGLNEAEVKNTYDFASAPENRHIKEVFFMGLRLLGSARDTDNRDPEHSLADMRLMPDDLIELLVDQAPEVTRRDIMNFNKLYFALLSIFGVKKCLYIQHYLVVRGDNGEVTPISELVDLEKVGLLADRYARDMVAHPRLAKVRFLASLTVLFANRRALASGLDLLRLNRLFVTGMNLKEVPSRLLLLGFITACDPYNFDSKVSINCGKGELSADGGFLESSAEANVEREARFSKTDLTPGARKKRP
jgi:uncharacterized radical SAM superfamily Fe-S cluster-containing enzyme